jgi:polyprenyldihydroxybenzoate methyltransferase / 3-demethylubiquinol 3-O-methyltransferase
MPPNSNEMTKSATEMEGKNFEQHEIDHFSQYSDDWMDPNGTWKILHLMNRVRIPLVVDGLISAGKIDASKKKSQNALKGLKILDVGCGAGILTEALAYMHADMVGLDAADDLIVAAREHSKRLNEATAKRISYVCDTIEEHADKYTGYYDVVVASEVVEHVNDKDSFLRGCAKALKVYRIFEKLLRLF